MNYILLLSLTLSNGQTYFAPASYYSSKYQCEVKVSQLAGSLNRTNRPWKYLCSEIIPEVPEEY
jgi:hypothetical protein